MPDNNPVVQVPTLLFVALEHSGLISIFAGARGRMFSVHGRLDVAPRVPVTAWF